MIFINPDRHIRSHRIIERTERKTKTVPRYLSALQNVHALEEIEHSSSVLSSITSVCTWVDSALLLSD